MRLEENGKMVGKKTSKNGSMEHFHDFEGITAFSDRHDHEFYGRTIKTIGRGSKHIHRLEGVTSLDDGHEHIISLYTGPAVKLDFRYHTHIIEGKTSINSRHNHALMGKLTRGFS